MPHPTPAQISTLLHRCITNKLPLPAKSIHAQLLKSPLLASDTFLFNRLIESYSQTRNLSYALLTFHSTPNPNIFSFNSILSTLSKSGHIDDACKVFDAMPERNVVSWNTMISALARNGFETKALELYYVMISEGFVPTHFTFASVLSACGGLGAVGDGQRCHGLVVKVGLQRNLFVENSLLGMYMKCGWVADAVELFGGMGNPNEVSFTAMMGGLVSSGEVGAALGLFVKMHGRGVCIDPVAVSSILGACARDCEERLLGESIHGLVVKMGFDSDLHVGNSLIDLYAKHGEVDNAQKGFDTMPVVNVVSWNALIAGYGQRGDGKMGMKMIEMMKNSGIQPDEVTYISLLGACTKYGDVETARQMFEKISSPSVASWNAILTGYCQEQRYQEAVELFRKMQYKHISPNRTTMAIIMSTCSGIGHLSFGKQAHSASIRAFLHTDMFVASGLVDMYSKCGQINSARQIFDRMLERDVVCWNSMITGFSLHSLNREAFSFFKLMIEDGMVPTEFSYASVINSCARLSSLPQGRQIHAQITKNGYDYDLYVGSSLIDMYSKCGNVNEAQQFFASMPIKNIVSWNEMIHGYAQNGMGEGAIEVFNQMVNAEVQPDSVSFISVLTACSHSGLVDEGIELLDSMEKNYGIEPLVDHYTCVIDSLGRAGRLDEAEKLVDRMKWKDDPIVWEVLLSSCAVHGDARLGRRAADELFRLDPDNSANYVLMSNIYAGLERWKDAGEIRSLMNDRGVVKNKGYSWVDQKSGVRAFMVDDSHAKFSANDACVAF